MRADPELLDVAVRIGEHQMEAVKLLNGGAPDMLVKAQIHATLALVDATVLSAMINGWKS